MTVENVGAVSPLLKSGTFNTRVGSGDQGPIRPGEAYEVTFTTGPNELPGTGVAFSFANMFIHSNDMFYAFEPGGLRLFKNGTPISGDVTNEVYMWDAGTEEDQEPGTGSNQPMQGGAESGPDDANDIVQVESNNSGTLEDDGYTYPSVSDVIQVTVSSTTDSDFGGYKFTVRIENVSDGTTVNGKNIPLSPGSWAVHFDQTPGGNEVSYPNFTAGEDAIDTGLEDIAEDGNPTEHAATLGNATGVTVPLSPGAFAVHSDQVDFYDPMVSASRGIEAVAEDGMPGEIESMRTEDDGLERIGTFGSGPLPPDESATFTVDAQPGDRLSLATMYVQSNDLFYAFQPTGIPLFAKEDQPVSGDMTDQLILYDAGTEGDQEPGVGLDQAPRQSNPDTGPDGEGSIVEVADVDDDRFLDNDGFDCEETSNVVRVTIEPQN